MGVNGEVREQKGIHVRKDLKTRTSFTKTQILGSIHVIYRESVRYSDV